MRQETKGVVTVCPHCVRRRPRYERRSGVVDELYGGGMRWIVGGGADDHTLRANPQTPG